MTTVKGVANRRNRMSAMTASLIFCSKAARRVSARLCQS
jgi:hypothetical protein